MDSPAKPKIVVAEALSETALERLRAAGEVEMLTGHDQASLIAAAAVADALLVRTYSLVNEAVIAAGAKGGRLKVIGRAGVGVDNIDVAAASRAGVVVVNTPAASTNAVAELVVGLVVGIERGIARLDGQVRRGEFAELRRGTPKATELQHQTLGVIGMGRIGRAVGRRLHDGLGMRIVYHDIREIGWLPFPAQSFKKATDVYEQADVVTLHVPLTRLTRGMIDAKALAKFKDGSYLINTSRGPVVDARALAAALTEGRLAGAAVDVFEPEPPPPDHPLMGAPNCILTPHIGSRTRESITAMNDVVDDVIRVLGGKPPMFAAKVEE